MSRCQSHHTSYTRGRDPPDLGRGRASLVKMSQNILHILLQFQLLGHPGVHLGRLQGPVDEGGGVDVGLCQGLKQGGHELHHVVPLAPADPVAVVAPVQTVQTRLRVQDQRQPVGCAHGPRLVPRPVGLDDVHRGHPRLGQDRVILYHVLQVCYTHPCWDIWD